MFILGFILGKIILVSLVVIFFIAIKKHGGDIC